MPKIRDEEVLQALAREYLQDDKKGERENFFTIAGLMIVAGLLLGYALGSYTTYQSPQASVLRSLKNDEVVLSKVRQHVCH